MKYRGLLVHRCENVYSCSFFVVPGADLLSPTKKAGFLSPGGRRVSIAGLPEKEAQISRPWDQMFDLVHLVAAQLDWNMTNLFNSAIRFVSSILLIICLSFKLSIVLLCVQNYQFDI